MLKGGHPTGQSDVWSFGILIWAVHTGGAVPYADLQDNQVEGWLAAGNRLDPSGERLLFPDHPLW